MKKMLPLLFLVFLTFLATNCAQPPYTRLILKTSRVENLKSIEIGSITNNGLVGLFITFTTKEQHYYNTAMWQGFAFEAFRDRTNMLAALINCQALASKGKNPGLVINAHHFLTKRKEDLETNFVATFYSDYKRRESSANQVVVFALPFAAPQPPRPVLELLPPGEDDQHVDYKKIITVNFNTPLIFEDEYWKDTTPSGYDKVYHGP